MSNFNFKILHRGFPQHFMLSAVYFSSLLDSVVFKKLEKTFINLRVKGRHFVFGKATCNNRLLS
jgi:hypothetical protein